MAAAQRKVESFSEMQIRKLKADIRRLRDNADQEEAYEHAFRMQNNTKYEQQARDMRNVLLTEIEIAEEALTKLEEQAT